MTKYNWNYWSSNKEGLKKSAKSQYYSVIQSDYEDYHHEHNDDQNYVMSKKRSSSSFRETFITKSNTTTTEVSSSSDINKNNVGKELEEWMLVIFVCDDYAEEPIKRYNVSSRYILSSPVFKALVRSCGRRFGAIVSQTYYVVLSCSIRFFESVHNLAMCQAKEEEEEKAKARRRRHSI